ncbi:hypothetical protein ANAPRD1_01268 [Anaplasma phagocytophilum]|nr:hypothetical protein ANAPC2_00328 [Anaplasma phagocytophilum]SBO30957.1 hypothetical protein ANAPC3_00364 [Anaplasma phagocytophilum]SBO31024.1 hypothetical protein ANAPC4_00366 [Anaplasma phagocytophilum]SCV66751.1 hypothetical protein ANAPRD1_01268 [Anaplasma phagocytophilum]
MTIHGSLTAALKEFVCNSAYGANKVDYVIFYK